MGFDRFRRDDFRAVDADLSAQCEDVHDLVAVKVGERDIIDVPDLVAQRTAIDEWRSRRCVVDAFGQRLALTQKQYRGPRPW